MPFENRAHDAQSPTTQSSLAALTSGPCCPGTGAPPPGEILWPEFLEPLGLSQKDLAQMLGITRVRLSEIPGGKRAVTPDTALRLARFFAITPEFWLGLQTDLDLWDTLQVQAAEYEKIKPVNAAA